MSGSGPAAAHRGGTGTPLVCLHGFMETWHAWSLALPALERRHAVLAPTLPGHAGGPPLGGPAGADALLDGIEAAMDAAGIGLAHVAGTSLGGHLALRLAERGRARSVAAFAPAGGWAPDDHASPRALLDAQARLRAELRDAGRQAVALIATREGRRRLTRDLTVRFEHIPADLLARLVAGVAGCDAAEALIAAARRDGWPIAPERIACPVRIVWGARDRLLPWPAAAAGLRAQLPHAEWIVLDDVGHAPQLDVPLEAAELILGLTGGRSIRGRG